MKRQRIAQQTLALLLAAALWLPCLHLFYRQDATAFSPPQGLSPEARQLLAQQLYFRRHPVLRQQQIAQMRATNPEWDFMARTYFVWALANIALRDPQMKPFCLQTMDEEIKATLELERHNGLYYFLMPYARAKPFVQQPSGSQFIDGEIAMILAARRVVQEKPAYKTLLTKRVELIVARMEQSPSHSAESYPDECWTFCNVIALDAIKMTDYVDGTDHSALIQRWLMSAEKKLVDPKSGLLISAYTLKGMPLYGPEGSSIWMVAHGLQLLDPKFAQEQYERAGKSLRGSCLGFGYAREWPTSWAGPADVDSAPVVPALDVSPGSTGMAFLGATSFHDHCYLEELTATVDFGAFPLRQNGRLRYCASNQVGDAVLLYSAVLGPLWQKVEEGRR